MTEEKLIKELVRLKLSNISIGYNELEFAESGNFADFQVGFRIDESGKSLTADKEGDWKNDWYVIGTDGLGDPVFISLNSEKIFTAGHGEGEWEALPVANNLQELKSIVNKLKALSKDREYPTDLESNPFKVEEIEEFENYIRDLPGEIETWFWSNFLAV